MSRSGYQRPCACRHCAGDQTKVFLNGEEISRTTVMVDADYGVALRLKADSSGNIITDENGIPEFYIDRGDFRIERE